MDFLLLYSRGLLVADAPLVGVEVVQAVAYVLREAEGDILVGQQEHTHRCVGQYEGGGTQVVERLLAGEFHLGERLAAEVFRHAEAVLRRDTLAALLAQAKAGGDTGEVRCEVVNHLLELSGIGSGETVVLPYCPVVGVLQP